jgi:segregation and condensation protein B
MAAAEQLGQAVMEFDSSATVETVVELDENGQEIIQIDFEVAEAATETTEVIEEVLPESEDKTDEPK